MANGRWKVGKDGQPEWEELAEGVSAPNQIEPPTGSTGGSSGSSTNTQQQSSPWDDSTGGWARSRDYYPNEPWRGAPANNPNAAPEYGYWGDQDPGYREGVYSPAQARFDDLFQNYWADDRAAVLADARYKPTSSKPVYGPGSDRVVYDGINPDGSGGLTGRGAGGGVTNANTPTTQSPSSPTGAAPQAWNEASFAAQFGRPTTPQQLLALEGRLNQAGIQVLRNAAGVAGKIQLPNGDIVDVITAAGAGGRGFQWLTGGGSDSGGGGNSTYTGGSPMGDDLYNILMGRATQSLDVNPRDSYLRNQVNAYQGQQERAARNYLGQVAEARGPNANLRGEQRMAAEKVGQSIGAFEADLVSRERDARRQEIQAALSGMLGYISDDKRLALQRELALLDLEARRAELSQRAYEFDTNDEFRRSPLGS